jgi:hypothetical protein
MLYVICGNCRVEIKYCLAPELYDSEKGFTNDDKKSCLECHYLQNYRVHFYVMHVVAGFITQFLEKPIFFMSLTKRAPCH